ncbi:MAG: hypothetical protein Q7J27_13465 [Syntrophales bacterium]|nr:hypothetical protein [Syntrophales bacterium]
MEDRQYNSDIDSLDPTLRRKVKYITDYGLLLVASGSYNIGYMVGYATGIQQMMPALNHIKIHKLESKFLSMSIDVIIDPDDNGFLAQAPDLPSVYGYGENRLQSIEMLKREIESLYEDLLEDDNFTEEWLKIRNFLAERIIE